MKSFRDRLVILIVMAICAVGGVGEVAEAPRGENRNGTIEDRKWEGTEVYAVASGLAQDPSETAAPEQKPKEAQPHNNVRRAREVNAAAPTVEQAKAFLDDAERRLFDLGVKQSRASWVQENFITFGTEAMAADAGEELNTLSVELARQAARGARV